MSLSARYDSSLACGGGGGDDDGGMAPARRAGAPPPALGGAPTPCAHCRAAAAVPATVRTRADFLCRACFLTSCLARSRKLLTHPLLVGSRVLLGVSGGASSRQALDAAALMLHSGRRRRWWAEGAVVHIDTSSLWQAGLLGSSSSSSSGAAGEAAAAEPAGLPTTALLTACLTSGLHTYIVPLEAAFTPALVVLPMAAPPIALGGAGIAPAPASGAQLNAAQPFAPLQAGAVADAVAQARAALAHAKATPALLAARAALLAAFAACGAAGAAAGPAPPARAAPATPPRDLCHALLQALITRLLVETASALRFPHLATAASLDTTACAVFGSMCSRGGATVPRDVATVDARFQQPLPFLPQRAQPARCLGALGEPGEAPPPLTALPSNWYPAVLQDSPGGAVGSEEGGGASASAGGTSSAPHPCSVTIVRVAQEVEAREAALVCRFKGLQGCTQASATFLSFAPPGSSVALQCRDVLVGLQAQFPSTLHNVVKTAKKVGGAGAPAAAAAALCSCCGAVCSRGAAVGARCDACTALPQLQVIDCEL